MEETNRKNKYHIIFAVVFSGVILSFGLIFTLVGVFGNGDSISDDYFSGKPPKETVFSHFDNACIKNENFYQTINELEYRIFGNILYDGVLAGKNDFIFPVGENVYGYDFLEDYTGRAEPDEKTIEHIYNYIKMRRQAYGNFGAEYILAVIPNSQTVYSENMPDYLGDISDKTLLALLSDYMERRGADYFVDLTDVMIAGKADGRLYNNTENSINALGAYYAYKGIVEALPSGLLDGERVLDKNVFEYSFGYTDGKGAAQHAGLAHIIRNNTVSLSGTNKYTYSSMELVLDMATTYTKYEFIDRVPENPAVLLELTEDWDKVQLTPFFSSTFGRASYRVSKIYNGDALENANPKIVIQVIREDELLSIADYAIYSSYVSGLTHGQHPYETMKPTNVTYEYIDEETIVVSGTVASGEEITFFGDGIKAKVIRAGDGKFTTTVKIRNPELATELCLRAKANGKVASEIVYVPLRGYGE